MGKLVPEFDSLLALIADMPEREQNLILRDLEMKKLKARRKK